MGKYMQFIGVIFLCLGREEKLLSYGLLGGISTQADTMGTSLHTFTSKANLKPHNNFCYSQVG